MAHEKWDIPRDDPHRDLISRQMRRLRLAEQRGSEYRTSRGGFAYVDELDGIQGLFAYIKKLPAKKVVDVGAGTTTGIAEIAESAMAKGLEFEATVLRVTPEIEKNLGTEHTHVTSVERLRGIQSESIACVVSVYSVAYSAASEIAVRSIDRVLVPGGVFKGVFGTLFSRSRYGLADDAHFRGAFQDLGYDVAIRKREESTVLLAIKPGGMIQTLAKDLLKSDSASCNEQLKSFR